MPPLIDNINAFVIAGGKSRRFGRDKALYPVDGVPLIERVLSVLGEVFTEIAIIADDNDRFSGLGIPCHTDIVKGWGPSVAYIRRCITRVPAVALSSPATCRFFRHRSFAACRSLWKETTW